MCVCGCNGQWVVFDSTQIRIHTVCILSFIRYSINMFAHIALSARPAEAHNRVYKPHGALA